MRIHVQEANAGKIISLSEFQELTKNATSLSVVLIKSENADYLASKEGLNITNAVTEAFEKAGYSQPTAKKVMMQSTSSSILEAMTGIEKNYELIYQVDELISDVLNSTILEIKEFASCVASNKDSHQRNKHGVCGTNGRQVNMSFGQWPGY